uniref:Uncharacterized protein n=1 Tax=Anguilla anguilla TaxID=7936 RepID=A0A0E9PJ65_ANGAN
MAPQKLFMFSSSKQSCFALG